MSATMVPMMVPVPAPGERNARRSFRRNALVGAAATAAPRSWSSMCYGDAPKETEASIRRRMVDLIVRLVSASGAITRDDLLGQFTEDEITAHFRPALEAAGAHRMAVTW